MLSCFVIMPFGEKPFTDAAHPGGREAANTYTVDFDNVYTEIIKSAVESIGDIECIRCDELEHSGLIHKKMLEQIYAAEVAVVDITTVNPNVFYELGVRHALVGYVTVIIKRKGTEVPFNIGGLEIIEYDPNELQSVTRAKQKIVTFIKNGLKERHVDSLVHQTLPVRIAREPIRLTKQQVFSAQLAPTERKICIITGDLMDVRCADVWVNSENTNMQMSRFYERSISGTVRYLGAKRNRVTQEVVEDTILNELTLALGGAISVPPGTVIATGSGELARSHKVKRVFHAAAVYGQIGKGFTPVNDVTSCIKNALELADAEEHQDAGLRSMLFPLIGTGQGGASAKDMARLLIETAIDYFSLCPDSCIQEVYFLCASEEQLKACQWALQELGRPAGAI